MSYKALYWFMSKKLPSKKKRSKYWRLQLKISQHLKEIEDEEDDDLKAEEATIVAANKDTINTKRINFKEEEKEEERKE